MASSSSPIVVPVPPDEQGAAGQPQLFRKDLRQQAPVVDGPVPAAGFRHGDPGNDGIRREGDVLRQGKEQLRQQPGRAGFRTVFEPEDQLAGNAVMGTEGPGRQVRRGIRTFPGPE